jgi:hypothetical protein
MKKMFLKSVMKAKDLKKAIKHDCMYKKNSYWTKLRN